MLSLQPSLDEYHYWYSPEAHAEHRSSSSSKVTQDVEDSHNYAFHQMSS